MQCPVCSDVTLVMSDRQGVEIDYCPKCRGVWLDRGELDKIIERSAEVEPTEPYREPRDEPRSHPEERERDYGKQDPSRGEHPHYHKKKRRGFLGDLFDFD